MESDFRAQREYGSMFKWNFEEGCCNFNNNDNPKTKNKEGKPWDKT